MARFRSLLDKVYPANVPENAPYRENYLKTAILSFLPDSIAIPILEDLRQSAIKCIPVSAEQLQRTAYSAERFAQITIKTPLQFSRTLQTAPVASQVQFNSIKFFVIYPLSWARKRGTSIVMNLLRPLEAIEAKRRISKMNRLRMDSTT